MSDVSTLTASLNAATRTGDLAKAYRVFQGLSVDAAREVALRAGFSVIYAKSEKVFFHHLQTQIAEAARNHTNGFGLRGEG